jgi:peroxiredoxin Q/BCP
MLKEGSQAPLFEGVDQNGDLISLANLKGTKVVLYFYPHDDTPTCTTQACNLRDNYSELTKRSFKVIGVSTDSIKKHKRFETKYNLPFALIADDGLIIVNQYKVWGEKQFMGRTIIGTKRTTFLIDEKGIIKKIIEKPVSKKHTEEILAAWDKR